MRRKKGEPTKDQRKLKKLSYELIPRDNIVGQPMYRILDELVEEHHEELTNARIALAWNLTWKPDVDGHVTLGKCKKASDLDRELAAFDFVIMLNAEFFQDGKVTDHQRRALLDHELCHATVSLDEDGEPKEDVKGRTVYRSRKHDIEEFSEIVERYGCYKRDLEVFAMALRRSRNTQLDLQDVAADPAVRAAVENMRPKKGSGIDSVTITVGDESVTLEAPK